MPADLRAIFESLGVEARGERPRSERVLERLLDLKRCVELGGVLDAPRPAQPAAPQQRAALDQAQLARLRLVEGQLLVSLRELRAQIDRRVESAFTGVRAAPDAAALHALIVERVGGDAPRAADARAIAAHVAPRYVAVIDAMLELIWKELSWRRKDVQQALLRGNAELSSLAALDHVLEGVFSTELELCRVQLQTTLGEALQTQLRAACASLPEGASAEALRSWFGPRGCIGRCLRDGRRMSHALLDLEWSALMGLLQAAMQASTGPDQPEDAATPLENDES